MNSCLCKWLAINYYVMITSEPIEIEPVRNFRTIRFDYRDERVLVHVMKSDEEQISHHVVLYELIDLQTEASPTIVWERNFEYASFLENVIHVGGG